MDDNTIDLVSKYWNNGQAVEAGRIVFEHLTTDVQPKWAAGIFKLVLDRSGVQTPLFDELLSTANDKKSWKYGHQLFSRIRDVTLQYEAIQRSREHTEEERMISYLLYLAELVAKVIYNATDPIGEFDEDSGWWIADSLRGFIDRKWNDDAFKKSAWYVLCGVE
jgi:hypothetical protein